MEKQSRNEGKTRYFKLHEIVLYVFSVAAIALTYFLYPSGGLFTAAASVIGVTSLLLNAKGNPAGQALMIVFSVMYGVLSYETRYYGEMITYLGMTAPMAAAALVSWLRHPFEGNRSQVRVNRIGRTEWALAAVLTVCVTVVFRYVLGACGTANLLPSTLSVATSFAAAYLTARRSLYFALAYAANDLVLIVLWTLAALENPAYVATIACFAVFFLNDLYGFMNWKLLEKAQRSRISCENP